MSGVTICEHCHHVHSKGDVWHVDRFEPGATTGYRVAGYPAHELDSREEALAWLCDMRAGVA